MHPPAMVELTEDECLAVSRAPLGISHLRGVLQIAIENKDTGSQETKRHETESTEADEAVDIRDAISSLLGALQGHRVAKKLRSKGFGGTVAGELASLFNRLDCGQIDTAEFEPLIAAVVGKAPDIEIWKQVLLLISSSSRITPPPGVRPSFGSTPRTHNSASHQGSEQTESLLYDALRDEFYDCSYVKVPGFFEKYFDNKSWTQKSKEVFDAVKHMHVDGRWSTFPSKPTENAVWEWWSKLQDKHLTHARGVYHTTKSKNEMVNTDCERQLDLFVKSRIAPTSDRHDWADVLVIGEHTISPDGGKKFLQLARYARDVFSAQPRRRLVHGFILYDTKLELHVFDRSGTFCQEPFDIHQKPERFIRVISGYCMMSDEELGLDTFIERTGQKEYITVVDNDGKDRRLRLRCQPIARRRAVVGRGTCCYCTADKQAVVKFSWVSSSKSPTEPELLKLANERKVKGVPRLIGHRQDVGTGELRSPLVFSKKRRLEGRLYALNRQRSSTLFSSRFSSGEGKKRKFIDAEQCSSKKLCQVDEADASFKNSQQAQASQTADEAFVDRVLCLQATQPAGRPLGQFSDVQELLRAIRDAIKVHRSLLLDGKILHRDISELNIIITNPDKNEGVSGMLIDLELATTLENGSNARTGLRRMTGTLKYMAIEILEIGMKSARPDLEHTYRHDLESFFYVFLSMCLSYGWDEGEAPREDPLREWYAARSYENMVVAKLAHMGLTGFESLILPKFSPTFACVKGLAARLRDILFLRRDKLRKETPAESPSTLYNQMIAAFDKAIESLGS